MAATFVGSDASSTGTAGRLAPECLFLLADFPRDRWRRGSLDTTALRWLEVHGWFRSTLESLLWLGRAALQDAGSLRARDDRVTESLTDFLSILDYHHAGESTVYFPVLAAADARLARAIDLLEADHRQLEAMLMKLRSFLSARPNVAISRECYAGLVLNLESLQPFMDRHFTDEENIVVPFLTLRGDPVRNPRPHT
jgi:iron-sulfur cluster repair protein YtfE (RIC family)